MLLQVLHKMQENINVLKYIYQQNQNGGIAQHHLLSGISPDSQVGFYLNKYAFKRSCGRGLQFVNFHLSRPHFESGKPYCDFFYI